MARRNGGSRRHIDTLPEHRPWVRVTLRHRRWAQTTCIARRRCLPRARRGQSNPPPPPPSNSSNRNLTRRPLSLSTRSTSPTLLTPRRRSRPLWSTRTRRSSPCTLRSPQLSSSISHHINHPNHPNPRKSTNPRSISTMPRLRLHPTRHPLFPPLGRRLSPFLRAQPMSPACRSSTPRRPRRRSGAGA